MKRWLSTIALCLLFFRMDVRAASMADHMRAEGKIYVVVGVLILIFFVLFAYLIFMDVRLRKVEKETKQG